MRLNSLDTAPGGKIPYTNGFVISRREKILSRRVEDQCTDPVVMSSLIMNDKCQCGGMLNEILTRFLSI